MILRGRISKLISGDDTNDISYYGLVLVVVVALEMQYVTITLKLGQLPMEIRKILQVAVFTDRFSLDVFEKCSCDWID